MAQRTNADERARETDPKFYLPGRVTAESGSRLERLWARIFNHSVDTPA